MFNDDFKFESQQQNFIVNWHRFNLWGEEKME